MDPASGATESSPDVIAPDTNAGNKRWKLAGLWAKAFNNLTLLASAVGFSISGGTTPAALSVEDNSAVNQDLTTDATPTFAGLIVPASGVNYGDPIDLDMDLMTGGSETGAVYASNTCKYMSVGKRVTVTGDIQLSAKPTTAGAVTISGLPFVVAEYAAVELWTQNVVYVGTIRGIVGPGTAAISLYNSVEDGSTGALAHTALSDTARFIFSITYFKV